VVVATGVSMDGHREVLGCAVGDSEDGAFWTEFLRSLRARGLGGVRLVISDQHLGGLLQTKLLWMSAISVILGLLDVGSVHRSLWQCHERMPAAPDLPDLNFGRLSAE
jgi:hypothetical protein